MSCEIRTNRIEPCKNNVGGIDAVYFVNYGDITGIKYNSKGSIVTSVQGGPAAFKYDVRGKSSYSEKIKTSRNNGTTFYEQSLKITLSKLSEQDFINVGELAKGRPNIIIQDNNGNLFLSGAEFGSDMADSDVVTGESMLDLSGYLLNFKALEKTSAKLLYKSSEGQSGVDALNNLGFNIAYNQAGWDYYYRVLADSGVVESLICVKY